MHADRWVSRGVFIESTQFQENCFRFPPHTSGSLQRDLSPARACPSWRKSGRLVLGSCLRLRPLSERRAQGGDGDLSSLGALPLLLVCYYLTYPALCTPSLAVEVFCPNKGKGMYNVPSFTLARTIGGLITWYWSSSWRRGSRRANTPLIILASGFILGEGFFSVVNLILQSAKVPHFK